MARIECNRRLIDSSFASWNFSSLLRLIAVICCSPALNMHLFLKTLFTFLSLIRSKSSGNAKQRPIEKSKKLNFNEIAIEANFLFSETYINISACVWTISRLRWHIELCLRWFSTKIRMTSYNFRQWHTYNPNMGLYQRIKAKLKVLCIIIFVIKLLL